MKKKKILLIGESWMIHTVETKGFDTFSFDYYATGTEYIQRALTKEDTEFVHLPCHLIDSMFPESLEQLKKYDAILISDVGANTFLLDVETFLQGKEKKNKLKMLREYVMDGGGLCMVGGYLSFMGIEGKGRYNGTPIEAVLPVDFQCCDDRQEHPEGMTVEVDSARHEILHNLPEKLCGFLGYNRATAKKEAEVLLSYEGDPILSIAEFGKGRSAAFASDCAPHWASREFCNSDEYVTLWNNIVKWISRT